MLQVIKSTMVVLVGQRQISLRLNKKKEKHLDVNLDVNIYVSNQYIYVSIEEWNMKYWIQYNEENGAILSFADFEIDGYVTIDVDDDFDVSNLYNYKMQVKAKSNVLVEITEEEKKELYPFLFQSEQEEQEIKLQQMMIEEQKQTFLTNLSDEQAKEIPLVYPSWADYDNGYLFEVGTRVNYNGGLWKCAQAHKKQSDWYPSASPTLWIELDKKESTGIKEDPIEVPTSASTSGFEYIKGKYYKEGTSLYLMNRQGMSDGESITLYYMPSQLVGHYFELIS